MNITYRLERAGENLFKVDGPHHCGPSALLDTSGRIAMRWRVTMECNAKLDERGFLVDQVDIAEWMARRAEERRSTSCELTAREFAERLIGWCTEQGASVHWLEVELRSAPYAGAIAARVDLGA